MVYFYTPIFENSEPGWLQYDVGMLDDQGATVAAPLAPGTSSPKCDKEGPSPRFVLSCPDGSASQDGWTVKTKAEVNTDYPGLIP